MAPRKPAKVKTPKWTLKKGTSGVFSTAIEEIVPLTYRIVGSRTWIESWFEPRAISGAEQVIYVSSAGDLAQCKEILAKFPVHGLDTETGQDIWTRSEDNPATDYEKTFGMEPWMPTSQITMAQYGVPEYTMIMEPRLLAEFRCFIESSDWVKILQNADFDFKFLMGKLKIYIVKLYDTMLQEQLITSGLNGYKVSLLDLARRYPPYRIIRKDVRNLFVTFRLGIDKFTYEMCVYGARDIVLLFDIRNGQMPKIKHWRMDKVSDLENELVMCTAEMEYGGVPMLGRVLTLGLTYYDERDAILQKQIIDLVGDTLAERGNHIFGLFGKEQFDFKVASGPARLEMFRNILGFDINDVRRETMAGMPHAAGPLIAEWTAVDKYRSTYGDGMVQRIDARTGRYHPRFTPMGLGDQAQGDGKENASTGRYSSNFQQLPQPIHRFAKVLDLGEVGIVQNQFADALRAARELHGIYQLPVVS